MQWLFRLLRLDDDSLRERRIDEYRRKMEHANTRLMRRYYFQLMQEEIAQRSPEHVKRMDNP